MCTGGTDGSLPRDADHEGQQTDHEGQANVSIFVYSIKICLVAMEGRVGPTAKRLRVRVPDWVGYVAA